MRYLRGATSEEVLAASTDPNATQRLMGCRPKRELWEFDLTDVGRVSVLVHYPARDTNGRLSRLFPNWLKWIEGTNQEAKNDAVTHHHLVDILRRGDTFATRPIIQDESVRIHDGRHRLFAIYDVYGKGATPFHAEVYWVHNWTDGVLGHVTCTP